VTGGGDEPLRDVDTAVDLEATLERVLEIAKAAGEIVMRVYRTDFAVDYKGANDPVTLADREANEAISTELALAYPGIPVVAEEGDPSKFGAAATSLLVWYVDPLDGTKEFVARNGEFAVMIGLAVSRRPVLGVVACPALGRTFLGAEGLGAYEILADGTRARIHPTVEVDVSRARVVVSRSHRSRDDEGRLTKLGAKELVPCGSAGIKAARVACGEADAYVQPRYAGKRWDSCAPEAIVRAAGGRVTDAAGRDLVYGTSALANDAGLVVTNGPLHDAIVARLTAGA
jgi:3'(2'), 5'-bisphosphate nucleotidase